MPGKNLLILIILCCTPLLSPAQRKLNNKFFGFSINLPQDWYEMDTSASAANLDNYTFTAEQLETIMEQRRGSVPLATMMKRRPEAADGIIPTIKIAARRTQTTSYEQLATNMKNSIQSTFIKINGFKFLTPFEVTTINGIKAIRGAISYTLPQGDRLLQARSYFYFFLGKGYFVQASFSDADTLEDERKLFDELKASIRFVNPA